MDAVIGIALTATTAGVTLASGDGVPHPAVDGVTVSLDEGRSPRAQLAAAVRRRLGAAIDYLLPGPTGGAAQPTAIRDLRTGKSVRGA